MNNLISVIVPIFNSEQYLCRCLDCIVNQTYQNLEIILVDDGSYDSSSDICDEYARNDKRIKVIHKENGGASSCRNAGLKIATGEYVAFVDSDDWLELDMYSNMLKAALNYQADTVVMGYFRVRENKKWAYFIENTLSFNSHDALQVLIENNWMKNYSWNKLYKRTLFAGVKYPEGQIFEDIPVAYKLFDKSNKVIMLNQIKYYYYIHSGSSVTKVTLNDYLDYCIGHQNRYNDLIKKYADLQNVMLERYITQTLNPMMERLMKDKKALKDMRVQANDKILKIQNFVKSELNGLLNCGAVGRVGGYKIKLFADNKTDKLLEFEQKFMPFYYKVHKYIIKG